MTDDLTKKHPQDASRINIREPWEVEYWCKALACTRTELLAAVAEVGTSAAAVRKHLGR